MTAVQLRWADTDPYGRGGHTHPDVLDLDLAEEIRRLTPNGAHLLIVPMDPADLDRLPPADLDVCGHCTGYGSVPTGGREDDGRDELTECPSCGGSGEIGGAL